MGNNLYVDNKTTEIDEILNFNVESLKSISENNPDIERKSENNYKNLKVWKFWENDDDKIYSQSVKLTKIKEDRFLLSSYETYIILIIFKHKDDCDEMSNFPNSLWGVVESSSNMTPRGLKYAFCTSNSENLESFLLSKRDFKNSEYKYLLFIWNGKNCAPLLRSHVLMKAFDMDKKFSNPVILPYLYSGFAVDNGKIQRNPIVNLNQIINNKMENLTEEPETPSTESFINFHETVYLLQLLYPKKLKKNKISICSAQKKNILFAKFNKNFLNTKSKVNYYENFTILDSYTIPNSKRSQISKENNVYNLDTFSLRNRSNVPEKEEDDSKSIENDEEEVNSSEYEEDDLNDDLYFEENMIGNLSKLQKNSSNPFTIQNNFLQMQSVKAENKLNLINLNNLNKLNVYLNREKDMSLSSSRNNNSSSRNNKNPNSENIDEDVYVVNNQEDSLNNISSSSASNLNYVNLNPEKKSIKNEKKNIFSGENSHLENYVQREKEMYNICSRDAKVSSFQDNIDKNPIGIKNLNNQIKKNLQIKELKVPKLIMGIQHKIINDDVISQRIMQHNEEEEKLDNLPESVIKKSSDKIFNLKKLDIKNILMNQENKNYDTINNMKLNLEKLDIMKINENFNIRDSDRKNIVMDFFSKNVSEIIDEFLFISNYAVAKNKDLIIKNKITHIINVSSDDCQNHFVDDGITYLNYCLKDHPMENIECIFYEVIDFIENAKEKNGRVLLHCNQGISRSVSLVIAYLIFSKKMNYDEAFKYVQSRRSISNPNIGFSIQLQNFYQRLYEGPEDFRFNPKIFAVGSFQSEQSDKIVCRMMNEPFFEIRFDNLIKVFDKRGVYIICTLDTSFIWIGSRILEHLKKVYLNVARNHIGYLQKFEKASKKILEIYDEQEPNTFISIWLDEGQKKKFIDNKKFRFSDVLSERNNWYRDVDFSLVEEFQKKNKNTIKPINTVTKTKKCFYLYPSIDITENMVDIEDLTENDFLLACYENPDENKYFIYSWRGSSVNLDQSECDNYVASVKDDFFNFENIDDVKIIEEIPFSESDEFINLL